MKRSKKILVLSHCLLNVNAKCYGNAQVFSSTAKPLVEFCLQNNIALIQLPCPEILLSGVNRKCLNFKFANSEEANKSHEKILKEQVEVLKDYLKNNYSVLAIVGVKGSPTCGIEVTHDESGKKIQGMGAFMKKFREMLNNENIDIPFVEFRRRDVNYSIKKLSEICEGVLNG